MIIEFLEDSNYIKRIQDFVYGIIYVDFESTAILFCFKGEEKKEHNIR